MMVASVAEVTADFGVYLTASKKGPVVVTCRGKPVAVLLAADDEDELERLLMGHSPKLQAILETARERFRAGAGIPHETFWKQIDGEKTAKTKERNGSRKNGRAEG
jgi:prevent-host-death family protein